MKIKENLLKNMQENSGYLLSMDYKLYKEVILKLTKPFINKKIDKVVSPEMKGMLYGPLVAQKLKIPFAPIFKAGRVPKKFVIGKKYVDYSNKQKGLEIGKIEIKKGDRVLFVDDEFESGASGKAVIKMVEKLGGKIRGISIIYNKLTENEEKFFKKYHLNYLIKLK